LQMQITADGYVAGPQGQLDWMTRNMDAPLLAVINELTDRSDTILLGRKMTEGFINYWEGVVDKPESPESAFAKKMVRIPKVVFSKPFNGSTGRTSASSAAIWFTR
jgi:dihydrofolate reductase